MRINKILFFQKIPGIFRNFRKILIFSGTLIMTYGVITPECNYFSLVVIKFSNKIQETILKIIFIIIPVITCNSFSFKILTFQKI